MDYPLASAWEPLRGLGAVGWDQEGNLALAELYTLQGWGLSSIRDWVRQLLRLRAPGRACSVCAGGFDGDYNLVRWGVYGKACDIAQAYVVRSGHTAAEASIYDGEYRTGFLEAAKGEPVRVGPWPIPRNTVALGPRPRAPG